MSGISESNAELINRAFGRKPDWSEVTLTQTPGDGNNSPANFARSPVNAGDGVAMREAITLHCIVDLWDAGTQYGHRLSLDTLGSSGDTYDVTVDGLTYTYVQGVSDTAGDVLDGLASDINAQGVTGSSDDWTWPDATPGTERYEVTRAGGDFAADGVKAGDILFVEDAVNDENKWLLVAAVNSATSIDVWSSQIVTEAGTTSSYQIYRPVEAVAEDTDGDGETDRLAIRRIPPSSLPIDPADPVATRRSVDRTYTFPLATSITGSGVFALESDATAVEVTLWSVADGVGDKPRVDEWRLFFEVGIVSVNTHFVLRDAIAGQSKVAAEVRNLDGGLIKRVALGPAVTEVNV